MVVNDTKTQFEQTLFSVKQQVSQDFPESPIKKAVVGILQSVIDSYTKTQSRIVWEFEQLDEVMGNGGIMATLQSQGRQHRIGFRFGQNERPELFVWSVLDYVADRPINHQIVIPLSEQASLREGGAEMQYWISPNPVNSRTLIAQACIGLGILKDLDSISPKLNNQNLDSIPLDLFKITL